MGERLRPGKVPWDLVARSLGDALPPEVLLGPGVGEDAAVVEIAGKPWAVATDPITFTSADAGRLAVIVNANDVAVRGATPTLFLATVLVGRRDADSDRVREMLDAIVTGCREVGAALVGGHTEVTPGIVESILSGVMLGRIEGRPITTSGARAGDRVAMVGSAGLEGTAILLAEHGDAASRTVSSAARRDVDQVLSGSWLSVVRPALAAADVAGVTALHDVTEGGVGEALWELSRACGLALDVDRDAIPVLEATTGACELFGLDPLGLIGSGALLVCCDPRSSGDLENALAAVDCAPTWIGRVTEAAGPNTGVPRFERDEILVPAALGDTRGVVFDMDGTLVDSRYDWPAIRRTLDVDGPSIIDTLNGLDEPLRSERWAQLLEFEHQATRAATLHAGARELLDLLHRRGIPAALVTNNTDDNTRLLLDRFGLEFDVVLTRDSGSWKPSAEPIEAAMRRLGVEPDHTLAVGDSIYDLDAARAAGCGLVCMVLEGRHRHGEHADLAFSDLADLRRALELVLPR
jgi:HAD superfamily hydrolase (TIGR01509 family)